MKHLYVIGPNNGGPFKVGISQSPSKRLSAVQTGHPFPLVMHFCSDPADNAAELESLMHDMLARYHTAGEWFDCDMAVIFEALTDAGLQPPEAPLQPSETPQNNFQRWVLDMRLAKPRQSEEDCRKALGITHVEFARLWQRGAGNITALACRALYHRFTPYG